MEIHSKQAKTPPISKDTKILCFDIESNGLHGEAFALGAVVVNADGKILDTFSGRTSIVGLTDTWVEKNVLPAIVDMKITHASYKDLREDFWKWFVKAEQSSDYVLVSNGYPVEYRFLIKCQEENLDERYWQHPFPILDLTSLLIQAEKDTKKRNAIVRDIFLSGSYAKHHPLHDATVSALAAFAAFKKTGILE